MGPPLIHQQLRKILKSGRQRLGAGCGPMPLGDKDIVISFKLRLVMPCGPEGTMPVMKDERIIRDKKIISGPP